MEEENNEYIRPSELNDLPAERIPFASIAPVIDEGMTYKLPPSLLVGDKGDKGDTGDTPQIVDGNWWIGGIDTGVQADFSNEEALRVSAETARAAAEATRVTAETGRSDAETARVGAEAGREDAETNRATAEVSRGAAETERSDSETARQTAETGRVNAEDARAIVESNRVTSETGRSDAEITRQTAEGNRESAETTRQNQETTRQNNETARQTAISNLIAKGDYDGGIQYYKNNTVLYSDGCGYQCIQDPPIGTAPTNATYWKKIAEKGVDGEGAGDMVASEYDTNDDGRVNAADHATNADNASNLGGSPAADFAKLNSPIFTGVPSGPTPLSTDNSTTFATTAFVKGLIDTLLGGVGASGDTLFELYNEILSNDSAIDALTSAIGNKLNKNFDNVEDQAAARTALGLGAVALLASIGIANVTGLQSALDGKEPSFNKNDAFNKSFGTSAGSVCQGNDIRLSDQRSPSDNSVSYAKVGNDLKSKATDNDGAWDFSATGIIEAAISTNTTVSFSNLQLNKTLKVKLVISNGATVSLPSYCKILEGSAEFDDGTFFLYFDCWDVGSGTELVVTSITQEAA